VKWFWIISDIRICPTTKPLTVKNIGRKNTYWTYIDDLDTISASNLYRRFWWI